MKEEADKIGFEERNKETMAIQESVVTVLNGSLEGQSQPILGVAFEFTK